MNPIIYTYHKQEGEKISSHHRVISFFISLFALILLTGCMKEDYSLCPDDQKTTVLQLLFEYKNASGNDKFNEEIHQVDVILFDENYTLYQQIRLGQNELVKSTSTNLNIEPGSYYVVGWGNISNNSLMGQLNSGNAFERSVILHQSTTTTDSLFYAPDKRITSHQIIETDDEYFRYKIVVAEGDTTRHTLPFMTAFHTINVFLKGLKDIESAELIHPEAQINNLPSWYNYLLEYPEEQKTNFHNTTRLVYHEETPLLYATFLVPHFENENDIFIRIVRDANGQEKADDIQLTEFLTKEKITVKDGNSQVINVEFEYSGNDNLVGITLPDWIGQSVNPSFE